MEILGIGPSELVFIVIIALIVLGPRDMQKAGRTIGKWLRRVVTSDGWKLFQQTSREIQTLPNRLMREAALDELKEVQRDLRQPVESIQPPAVLPAAANTSQSEPPDPIPFTDEKHPILPPRPSTDWTPKDKEQNA
jgi:sec-independent protein translocase protein TatB